MLPRVVLYKKPGCCLCEKARVMISRVIEQKKPRQIDYAEIDISHDPVLEDKYNYSLPVILVNDKVVSELKVDGRAIREALG